PRDRAGGRGASGPGGDRRAARASGSPPPRRHAAVKVARSVTPREVRIEDSPDPEPSAGEVVVRVLACGVCGSDVLDAWVTPKLPAVLGHELVGEVEALGSDVRGV